MNERLVEIGPLPAQPGLHVTIGGISFPCNDEEHGKSLALQWLLREAALLAAELDPQCPKEAKP